ncbi:MAG: ATP-binding protein [Armatimonadota bacterium]
MKSISMSDTVASLVESEEDNRQTLTMRVEQNELTYQSAEDILAAVQDMIVSDPSSIVVDIDKVRTIDSSGLRVLLNCARLCESKGIVFRLDNPSKCITRMVALSGLGQFFGLPQDDISRATPRQDVNLKDANWTTVEHVALCSASVMLRDRIVEAAMQAGAVEESLCDIVIAVGEALSNAYQHGSPCKITSSIRVKCMSCAKAFVVEIEDQGEAFDPETIPIPDLVQDHGRGIHIMRQAMDMVEYSFNHPGNRVRMVKWLQSG